MVKLKRRFTGACNYALLVLLLALGLVAANSNFVSAQACTAQLGSPNISMQQYYGANFEVALPVSVTCQFYAGQLYAAGTAYDTTYNSNVGTANSALSSAYGGNEFSGQLQFNLPTSAESHSVQFSVSIYSTQTTYGQQYNGGALLTTASATFVISPSYSQGGYQNYPSYPSYPTYPSYPSYPPYSTYPTYPSNPFCSNYPWYPSNGGYPWSPAYPSNPGYPHYPSNNYFYHPYCYPNSGYYYSYYYRNAYNNNYYYCNPSRNHCNHH